VGKAIVAWLIVACAQTLQAQHASDTVGSAGVFGTVRDTGGRALGNTSIRASVFAADPTIGPTSQLAQRETSSDEQGRYNLDGLPSGAVILEFRRIGYLPLADTLLLQSEMRWERNVTLRIVPHALDTVRVEAAKDKYQQRLTDVLERYTAHPGAFITRRQIDSLNPSTATDLFRRRVGVIVHPGQSGTGKIEIPQPDFSNIIQPKCPGVRYFVNGVETPVDSLPLGLDTWSPGEIETIEVYRYSYETPPAFLDPGRNCGAIAIWTRKRSSPRKPKKDTLSYSVPPVRRDTEGRAENEINQPRTITMRTLKIFEHISLDGVIQVRARPRDHRFVRRAQEQCGGDASERRPGQLPGGDPVFPRRDRAGQHARATAMFASRDYAAPTACATPSDDA
jgi:hypothetical protein